MHVLLAAALLLAQADSADAGLRMVLGADAARPDEPVPGILLVSTPDGRTRPATLRVTSASPARLWWRAGAGAACPDTARGEPEIAAGHLVGGDDAFYFCARPRTRAPLRLVASVRAGAGAATTVAELPAPARGGMSAFGSAAVGALLGLISGIAVNYATAWNQRKADREQRDHERETAERKQRMETENAERAKRLEILDALRAGVIQELQDAAHLLSGYVLSKPAPKEHPVIVACAGLQAALDTPLTRGFLETEGAADLERFTRAFELLADYNDTVRVEESPRVRRDVARQTVEELQSVLTPG
ncbi:MAG TPA: hypothetical protein VFQ45_21245 [Longimicrobium sp.]|nr:hypothetical protein [Longimicrobium sp.]